jgi:hypothetical protein
MAEAPALKDLVRRLSQLPSDRLSVLVVRSMPFGDLIEDDTRRVVFSAPLDCPNWHRKRWAYRICSLAKRHCVPAAAPAPEAADGERS